MIIIKDQIDDIIKISILNDGYIYHYTSVEAVRGIFDNEQFWATKSDFLNDKMEFKYTYQLFAEHILKNIKCTGFREKLIEAFEKEIESTNEWQLAQGQSMNGYYIVSFSKDPDSLLLWTEFSDSMGYNLEFKFNTLLKSFENKIMWHGEVVYDKETQLKYLNEALNNVIKLRPEMYNVKSIDDFDERTDHQSISYLALDLYVACTVYSMFYKQQEFEPEKEYRFVFSAIHEKNKYVLNPTKMHFRVKNDALIPYIKVPCKPLEALNTVRIGPKNNIDIATAGIKYYCREKKINVPIIRSGIPLRY